MKANETGLTYIGTGESGLA